MSKFENLINAAREHLAERIETIKSDKSDFYSSQDLEEVEAERFLIEAQADVLEFAGKKPDQVTAAANATLDEMYSWGSIHHGHLDCLRAALLPVSTEAPGVDPGLTKSYQDEQKRADSALQALEQLQAAIRSGAGLSELTRMVGPAPEELELAKGRVRQMEALAEQCQWRQYPDAAAQRARDSWQRIANTQTEYENRYY